MTKACGHYNTIFCLLLLEIWAACYFCIFPVCKTSWELQGDLLWALILGDLGWEEKGCIVSPLRAWFHTTALTLPSVLMLRFHRIMGYQKTPKQNSVNVSHAKKPKHSNWRCFFFRGCLYSSFAGHFFIMCMHMEEQKAWYLTWINEFFQEGNVLLTGLSAHRACVWQGSD